LPAGAIVERSVPTHMLDGTGTVEYILHDSNFATASRIAEAVNALLGGGRARALDAARVSVTLPGGDVVSVLGRIEQTLVVPDQPARVVVNERTGTVVSGGGV